MFQDFQKVINNMENWIFQVNYKMYITLSRYIVSPIKKFDFVSNPASSIILLTVMYTL